MARKEVREFDYLTVAEVAEQLNISERTVRRWMANGEIPFFRLGRAIRISRGDLKS
ncbi:MAG: helix-turn-helix domain-containing protein, partial [Pseudomonadota bacterium]